jgi:hypothetical protein
MPIETEFVVLSCGLETDSIDDEEQEIWVEVVNGSDAGERLRVSYRNAGSDLKETMNSLEEDDVITAKIEDNLSGWSVVDVEE